MTNKHENVKIIKQLTLKTTFWPVTISIKKYHNTRSARRSVKNIQIIQGGQNLTAQAGFIPVVQFLKKHGFASKIEQTLDHQRGATGVYDEVDMILLPLVAIIGGASISSIVTVWNDRVLCLAAGWLRIPDETNFGRILRTFTQKKINEMETLNHRMRASIGTVRLVRQ